MNEYEVAWEMLKGMMNPTEKAGMEELLRQAKTYADWANHAIKLSSSGLESLRGILR